MNSVSGKIVYECVSQRDLSLIWPDDPPIRPAYKTSQLSVALGTSPQHQQVCDCFGETHKTHRGFSRVTSLVTSLWKNPRYYRWLLTIVISFIFACILGFFNSYGALYMYLRKDLHSSATETGWVASLAWSLCILSPLITALYQRLGPRMVAIIGIILCFIGLFASTFAQNVWTLYLTFGIVFGVGVNFVFVSSVNLITSYYDSHECAMPTTLPGVGATSGMLVFCPVLEIVFKRFGWRMSLRVIASIIFVVGLAGSLLFRLPPSPDKSSNSVLDKKDKLEKLQLRELKLNQKKERVKKSKDNYKLLLKDPMHWVFGVATLISSMALLCNVINLNELMSVAGYSDERTAFFMSILGFVDTGGRLITAIFGDRLPCARILMIPVVCLLNGIVTFMLTITTQTAAIIIYITVVGVGRAIMYSIVYAASVETFGHPVYQESFAILLLMNGLGCLFAPLVPGLSYDLTGSYDAANYCFSILWLVSCAKFLAVYFMKNYRNKQLFASQKETRQVIEEGDVDPEAESSAVKTVDEVDRAGEPLETSPDVSEYPSLPRYDKVAKLAAEQEKLIVVSKVTAV